VSRISPFKTLDPFRYRTANGYRDGSRAPAVRPAERILVMLNTTPEDVGLSDVELLSKSTIGILATAAVALGGFALVSFVLGTIIGCFRGFASGSLRLDLATRGDEETRRADFQAYYNKLRRMLPHAAEAIRVYSIGGRRWLPGPIKKYLTCAVSQSCW
jgi:hypothetical protein